MNTVISDITVEYWQRGRRTRPATKGWIKGNAPCCIHNGESVDTKSRGNLLPQPGGSVTYSCFNCGFTATYKPGYYLNFKFRKLLGWLGVDDVTISRLKFEALRAREALVADGSIVDDKEIDTIYNTEFDPIALPQNTYTFAEYALRNDSDEWIDAFDYVANERGLELDHTLKLMWSSDWTMNKRVIIPYFWKQKLIGYCARSLSKYPKVKPNYLQAHTAGYVYNLTEQDPLSKFIIVTEGVFDALSIDGVAVLHGTVDEKQANLIDSTGKEIIVLPDRAKNGMRLVDAAIELGWGVSFPEWHDDVKDANDAVRRYGKLFTIQSILQYKVTNRLKIELYKKKFLKV